MRFFRSFIQAIRRQPWIGVSLIFAFAYGLFSLVPHWNFRTNAFDLGIFNQTLFQYAHLILGPNTLRDVPTLLADHFEPIMFLFAPLYWIFRDWTLLLIQIAFVIFGGIGVYFVVQREANHKSLALYAMICFYLFWGLFEALAFDYHNNVIGAMLIPWLFYFFSVRRYGYYYLLLILFLFTKENMALMSVFLGLSLMMFSPKSEKKHGAITFLVSIIYFVFVLKIVIPYFNHGTYDHWSYDALGKGPVEAIGTILRHPFQSLILLFSNTLKIKSWILILLSGGFLAVCKPKYSLLLLPILAQKFFSSNDAYWGYLYQYSVEFAPILPIAAFLAIDRFTKQQFRRLLSFGLIAAHLFILLYVRMYDGSRVTRLARPSFYGTSYDRSVLLEAMNMIPAAASVSAQNTIVPHLSERSSIYLLPSHAHEADYVILNSRDQNVWPVAGATGVDQIYQSLRADSHYSEVYGNNGISLFKRI